MAFPWICFKCGFDAVNKAELVFHIIQNGHKLSEEDKDTLLRATEEVIYTLREQWMETLHEVFGPVLDAHRQWKEHPETFIPDTDMDRYVSEMRAHYKVTPKEWAEVEAWFRG